MRDPATPPETLGLPFVYLSLDEVLTATGLKSKSNLYSRIASGDFPEPDRLSTRCSRWRSVQVAAWLREQAAANDAEREKRAQRGRQHALHMLAARNKAAA